MELSYYCGISAICCLYNKAKWQRCSLMFIFISQIGLNNTTLHQAKIVCMAAGKICETCEKENWIKQKRPGQIKVFKGKPHFFAANCLDNHLSPLLPL